MSHEIRTPLHNIIGLAELLRRDEAQPAQQQRLRSLPRVRPITCCRSSTASSSSRGSRPTASPSTTATST
ncbi:MAG: hypothetical protein MZV65_18600 [Chromatiales bacterium]|nr:hypothetical protein [Chromatiales bacterium]